MRKNIKKVLDAFIKASSDETTVDVAGDSRRTCSTNGNELLSYQMVLAWRRGVGDDQIWFVRKRHHLMSRTTKVQLNNVSFAIDQALAGGWYPLGLTVKGRKVLIGDDCPCTLHTDCMLAWASDDKEGQAMAMACGEANEFKHADQPFGFGKHYSFNIDNHMGARV